MDKSPSDVFEAFEALRDKLSFYAAAREQLKAFELKHPVAEQWIENEKSSLDLDPQEIQNVAEQTVRKIGEALPEDQRELLEDELLAHFAQRAKDSTSGMKALSDLLIIFKAQQIRMNPNLLGDLSDDLSDTFFDRSS